MPLSEQCPRVAVYCDHLLAPSQTFVRSQGEALTRFAPVYIGSHRVPGVELPPEKVWVLSDGGVTGRLKEAVFKLWGISPGLKSKLKSLRVRLIHAHFGPCGVYALPIARATRLPLIVTFHGSDATMKDECAFRYGDRKYLAKRRVLQHSASLFIAVSPFVREVLLKQGFPEDKIAVHYIGVDTSVFRADPMVRREPVVLFVGRLIEKKGCEYLIRAMAIVQRHYPQLDLVIIGDGPLRKRLEQLARESLRKSKFLGVQGPDIVRSWMNRARIFSVPSISEGFGIVFVESQAMGLPVVSFATGGIVSAVSHGETGFLHRQGDYEGLAQSICTLMDNEPLWHSFSLAGQKRIRSSFDLTKQTELLEKIYDNIAVPELVACV